MQYGTVTSQELILFFFRIKKDQVELLMLVNDNSWKMPTVKGKNSSMEDLVDNIEKTYQFTPLCISMDLMKTKGLTAVAGFLSKLKFKSAKLHKGAKLTKTKVNLDGTSYNFVWVHPRRFQREIREPEMTELYRQVLNWVVSHDFAASLLVNNLDPLR